MFRHTFLLLTLILGLTVFSGCTSSSDDDTPVVPQINEPVVCGENQHYADDTNKSCVDNIVTPPVQVTCIDGADFTDETNSSCACNEGTHFEDDTNTSCIPDVVVEKTLKTLYLSGVAIDGYIKDANITVNGKSALSDKDGKWTAKFEGLEENETIPESSSVAISGGIDISTGNSFEGVLSKHVEASDFASVSYKDGETAEEPQNIEPVVVTPLTTLVAHTIKSNKDKGHKVSKAEAQDKVAKAFGLKSVKAFNSDPISSLNSDDNSTEGQASKVEAAESIKQALALQKMVESLSKSAVNEDDNSTSFEDIFNAVSLTVAEKIDASTTEEEVDLLHYLLMLI